MMDQTTNLSQIDDAVVSDEKLDFMKQKYDDKRRDYIEKYGYPTDSSLLATYKSGHLNQMRPPNDEKIDYAFVVFRSMDGQKQTKLAYSSTLSMRVFTKMFFCCYQKQNDLLETKYIGNKWPSIRVAKLPENINW